MSNAITLYAQDVKTGAFPGPKESISMDAAVMADIEKEA